MFAFNVSTIPITYSNQVFLNILAKAQNVEMEKRKDSKKDRVKVSCTVLRMFTC